MFIRVFLFVSRGRGSVKEVVFVACKSARQQVQREGGIRLGGWNLERLPAVRIDYLFVVLLC